MRLVCYSISVAPFLFSIFIYYALPSLSALFHSLTRLFLLFRLHRFILSSITSETWLKRIGQEPHRRTRTRITCNKIIERRKFRSNPLSRLTSATKKLSIKRNWSTQWNEIKKNKSFPNVFLSWSETCFTFWLALTIAIILIAGFQCAFLFVYIPTISFSILITVYDLRRRAFFLSFDASNWSFFQSFIYGLFTIVLLLLLLKYPSSITPRRLTSQPTNPPASHPTYNVMHKKTDCHLISFIVLLHYKKLKYWKLFDKENEFNYRWAWSMHIWVVDHESPHTHTQKRSEKEKKRKQAERSHQQQYS